MKIAQTRSFKGKIVKENFLPSGNILHIDLSVVNHWCLLSSLLIGRIQIGVIDKFVILMLLFLIILIGLLLINIER